jgi:hypothetical protein
MGGRDLGLTGIVRCPKTLPGVGKFYGFADWIAHDSLPGKNLCHPIRGQMVDYKHLVLRPRCLIASAARSWHALCLTLACDRMPENPDSWKADKSLPNPNLK